MPHSGRHEAVVMRVLILTIEAFGGLGGIAKYSRDLS